MLLLPSSSPVGDCALISQSAPSFAVGDAEPDLKPDADEGAEADADGDAVAEDDDADDEGADLDPKCDFVEALGSPRATALMRSSSANDSDRMFRCSWETSVDAKRDFNSAVNIGIVGTVMAGNCDDDEEEDDDEDDEEDDEEEEGVDGSSLSSSSSVGVDL